MSNSTSLGPKALADFSGTVVLVGAGKMGSAMLSGWLRLGLSPARIVVLEPNPSPDLRSLAADQLRLNPTGGVNPATRVEEAMLIVVAVKPQTADSVMPLVASLVSPATTVVSVMAGRTLGGLERPLPPGTAVVRAMPNMPAAIGRGITVAVPNAAVTGQQRGLVDSFLTAIGTVEWVTEEPLLDAVTAVSGSGPAYVFLLAESLIRAAVAAGLPTELSARLARATIAGSGELLARAPLAPEALRESVTSPGGTTAAALDILMADREFERLLERAVAAAARRSRELAE